MSHAIFVLSHGRAKELKTYQTLRDAGYTGMIKVVVDDLDEQLEEYKERFGEDVCVFDKIEIAENVDCMTNTGELRSVVYARNYSDQLANDLGLDFYAEFDDDIDSFSYKYDVDGKLKTKPVKNMDDAVQAIVDFMSETKSDSVGICHPGILFGGAGGTFSKGLGRNFNQAVFMRTGAGIEFKGLTNQDVNALFLNSRVGKLMFEVYFICHTCPERGTNDGGLHDLYIDLGKYKRCFTTVMCVPDICTLDERNEIAVTRRYAFPKILSGRWKK